MKNQKFSNIINTIRRIPLSEAGVPAKQTGEKVITVRHKTSGKEIRVVSTAAEKYKKMGYEHVKEEVKEPTGKLKDACWKGYTAVGMKMKNGRKVPNCVPVKEQFASDKPEPGREAEGGRFTSQASKPVSKPAPQASPRNEEVKKDENEYDYEGDMVKSDLRSIVANSNRIIDMVKDNDNLPEWCQSKITLAEDYVSTVANYLTAEMNEEVEQIEEMPGANMDTRAVHKHLRKAGWSLTRSKGAHDVYTHPKSEKHIAVPRHKQLKAPLVRGIMKDAQVSEEVEQIEESRGHKILATKFAQIDARKKREQEAAQRAAEEMKKKEPVKEEEKKCSWQKDTGWKKTTKPAEVVDKSGAKHTAMSRAKHLAKMASRRKVMEQDHNNQVDNIQTPAKRTLAFKGVVKNTEKPTKDKKLAGSNKFEPEPELNTQIMRNNF